MNGGAIHCFFCGGSNCKYEKYEVWKNMPHTHIGIEGLFSNWITDNILATARPSSKVIAEYKIIEQFKRLDNFLDHFFSKNIQGIINLQLPGEHAHCGDGLNSEGFTYSPEEFMKENSNSMKC
jgi:protein tyrosine phosphatase domain-containing protein 1